MNRRVLLFIFLVLVPSAFLLYCAVRRVEPVKSIGVPVDTKAKAGEVGYYPKVDGLVGEELKRVLHRAIRNHRTYRYQDLWTILPKLDQCPSNHENILLLYTRRSQPAAFRDRGTKFGYEEAGYTLVDSWNREHVWPKSHGFSDERDTAYTDLHHIRPTDRSVNSAKNTRSFHWGDRVFFDNRGEVETPSKIGAGSWTWEPPDEVKGDIARMLFYMAVRYEGPGYDLELVDSIVPRQNKAPVLGKLSTLLEWHVLDPVDDMEKERNDRIYYDYQGNRNPFIDHPEWVDAIWKNN